MLDWSTYKRLCDQPDYWSAWMIDQSANLLDRYQHTNLSARLRQALDTLPLIRPADHKGDERTLMHQLQLSVADRRLALSVIQQALDEGLIKNAGYVAAWQEYADYANGLNR